MLVVFALLHLKWRSIVVGLCVTAVLGALAWTASPHLQQTTSTFLRDYQALQGAEHPDLDRTDGWSSGRNRCFFLPKLRSSVMEPDRYAGCSTRRPSIRSEQPREIDRKSAQSDPECRDPVGHARDRGTVCDVAACICCCFAATSLASWIGLLVVVQNFATSLFNSHLFDFNEGWMYVLGVGVAGGMVSAMKRPRERRAGKPAPIMTAGMHPGDGLSAPVTPIFSLPASDMMRLSTLTSRNALIAAHDALATALAVFASFYLRFEGGDISTTRVPLLLHILPYFIAFSVVVCYVLNLTTTKWRFISLPDALNILRAATVLTVALLVLDYIFVAPNVHGTFFVGQDHHRPLLVPRDVLPERAALCLPLFPLHARPPSCPHRRSVAGAADRPRRRCRSPAARDRKRRRHAAVAGRRVVALDGRSRPVDPQYSGAWRDRRHRGRDPRFRQARQADHARGDDAVGIRSGSASRKRADAGAPARADRQPSAVAGERRYAAADDGRCRGPAAASQRRISTTRASKRW